MAHEKTVSKRSLGNGRRSMKHCRPGIVNNTQGGNGGNAHGDQKLPTKQQVTCLVSRRGPGLNLPGLGTREHVPTSTGKLPLVTARYLSLTNATFRFGDIQYTRSGRIKILASGPVKATAELINPIFNTVLTAVTHVEEPEEVEREEFVLQPQETHQVNHKVLIEEIDPSDEELGPKEIGPALPPSNLGVVKYGRVPITPKSFATVINNYNDLVITRRAKWYNRLLFRKEPSTFKGGEIHNLKIGRLIERKQGDGRCLTVGNEWINNELFTYLRMHKFSRYTNRQECLDHLEKLGKRYWTEELKLPLQSLSSFEMNRHFATIGKAVDEMNNEFLLAPERQELSRYSVLNNIGNRLEKFGLFRSNRLN